MDESTEANDTYSEKEALQEERYLWMARAFSLVALLAFVADILMLIALSGLTPLMRVKPFYFHTQDKDQQVILVGELDVSSMKEEDLKTLQESLIREYLLARYGISSDYAEVEKRWGIDGIVYAMSEYSVFDTFFRKEASPLLEKAKGDGMTRDVRINWVNRRDKYSNGVSIWQAQIETIDMGQRTKKAEQIISKWDIKLEVSFQPSRRKMEWSQRLQNPLGFTVINFERVPSKENEGAV